MANASSLTSGLEGLDESDILDPAEPDMPDREDGSSDKALEELTEAIQNDFGHLKALWAEKVQKQQLTITKLERHIKEQNTMTDRLRGKIVEQGARLKESEARVLDSQLQKEAAQGRVEDLEARLVEEKRRIEELLAYNAELAQTTAAFHGVFARHRAVVERVVDSKASAGTPVGIPIPGVAATEQASVAVADGPADSVPAPRDQTPPPSAPNLPVVTVAEHVDMDLPAVFFPPPPVSDVTAHTMAKSVGAGVGMPSALSIMHATESVATAPLAHKQILVTLPKSALRVHLPSPPTDTQAEAAHLTSPEISAPTKTVAFSSVSDQGAGIAVPAPGKRKRAETLLTANTCKVCLVEFADQAELRGHTCHGKPRYPCRVDGCGKIYSHLSGMYRHEKKAHDTGHHYDHF
ncbi:protein diaphanous homolog 1-like [Paramacrobiotus metropolitanus]|uniref:protein diaphanous homolog 1-like n=1 Tax=Paramacrobiotus metropolitanus TaxID=2943436 RepID=UPI0024461B67|nr:protein diaphanous homolog 1-like [Paramacrobiotus metropolitanus]XP_055329011.1 protein diaphanous homolog 1-like [Paramacrobiotus metropolitanus]